MWCDLLVSNIQIIIKPMHIPGYKSSISVCKMCEMSGRSVHFSENWSVTQKRLIIERNGRKFGPRRVYVTSIINAAWDGRLKVVVVWAFVCVFFFAFFYFFILLYSGPPPPPSLHPMDKWSPVCESLPFWPVILSVAV